MSLVKSEIPKAVKEKNWGQNWCCHFLLVEGQAFIKERQVWEMASFHEIVIVT